MATTLFLVRASHPTVPGTPTSIHFTLADANAKAFELVETIMRDVVRDCPTATELRTHGEPPFSVDNWTVYLKRTQIARILEQRGDPLDLGEDVEVEADEHVSPDEWLADESGCDVWVEHIEADMPPVRIVLNMTGGVVQGASIDHGAIDMLVIDYDRETLDPRNEITVPQPDECEGQEANVVPLGAFDVAPAWVDAVFTAHEAPRSYTVRYGTRGDHVGVLLNTAFTYDEAEEWAERWKDKSGDRWARVEREPFRYSPDRCPSNHWNRGDDVCGDCGTVLS